MAQCGKGYFDDRGQYFKTPQEATLSDLAALLGRIGEGESLAPGIAHIMLEKREVIERIYSDHDAMLAADEILPTDEQSNLASISSIRSVS